MGGAEGRRSEVCEWSGVGKIRMVYDGDVCVCVRIKEDNQYPIFSQPALLQR